MPRWAVMICALILLSTATAYAASGARRAPVLYRTIRQDRTGWLMFLPNNRTLICGHRDGTAGLYDVHTGGMVVEFNFSLNAPRYAGGGQWLYAASTAEPTDGVFAGIDAATLEHQRNYDARSPQPESLWITADGRRILIKSRAGTGRSRIVDAASGKVAVRIAELPAGAVFTPDLRFAAYRKAHSIMVADTRTGAVRRRIALPGGDAAAIRMAFSPDGRCLAVTSAHGFAKAHGVAGFTYRLESGKQQWIHATVGRTERLVWSPRNRWLLLAARNTDLAELVDVRSSRQIGSYMASPPGSKDEVQGLAFSHDNRWMALCSSDGEIKVYRLPR